MKMIKRSVKAGLVIAAATSLPLSAQPVRPITLAPASARLSAEFIGMTSLRELADGRVIVTDGRDQKIYLADFTANTATVLGRKGKGPGEWSQVGFVYPIGNDSSMMNDMSNGRWLTFAGGKIAGTIPPDHPAVKTAGEVIYGADDRGHVLIRKEAPRRNGETEFTRKDSNVVALVDRTTGRSDTIARVRVAPHIRIIQMDKEGRVHSDVGKVTDANAQAEEAVLGPDGWLAVLRLDPLRVDWRSPGGQWMHGAPLPLKPEVVSPRDRKAIQKRYDDQLAQAKKEGFPPPSPPLIPDRYNVWFSFRGLFIASDGRLVMRRPSTVLIPARRYVVVNRRGIIDGQFTLGEKEDIIGFGAKSIYVGSLDDNDIQTLRRHPWS